MGKTSAYKIIWRYNLFIINDFKPLFDAVCGFVFISIKIFYYSLIEYFQFSLKYLPT